MTPTGLEESDDSPCFSGIEAAGCNAGCNTLPAELIELWQNLDDDSQANLLNIARGLAALHQRDGMARP